MSKRSIRKRRHYTDEKYSKEDLESVQWLVDLKLNLLKQECPKEKEFIVSGRNKEVENDH